MGQALDRMGRATPSSCLPDLHKDIDSAILSSKIVAKRNATPQIAVMPMKTRETMLKTLPRKTRVLPNLRRVDDLLWPTASLLRLSSHVSRNGNLEHDHRYLYTHHSFTHYLEVAHVFTAEDRRERRFSPRIFVGLCRLTPLLQALTALFSVCGISIARVYFFFQAAHGFGHDYDITCKFTDLVCRRQYS